MNTLYIPSIDTSELSDETIKLWFGIANDELQLIRRLEKCNNIKYDYNTITYWVNGDCKLVYYIIEKYYFYGYGLKGKNSNMYKALKMILPK